MEIASIIVALAAVILTWSTLKELLVGLTSNTRRTIRVVDKTTRGWLADASIEELSKASSYCSARRWSIAEDAQYGAYRMAMDIEEAEPSQQKKIAEELAAYLKLHQLPVTPTPTAAPSAT